jgi:aryl-alcohol dehydrogenase-like predicted oxidoreductase
MGVGVIPWSPLARGRLTGSRSRDGEPYTVRAGSDAFADQLYEESDFEVIDAVTALAAERGMPPAQIASESEIPQLSITLVPPDLRLLG